MIVGFETDGGREVERVCKQFNHNLEEKQISSLLFRNSFVFLYGKNLIVRFGSVYEKFYIYILLIFAIIGFFFSMKMVIVSVSIYLMIYIGGDYLILLLLYTGLRKEGYKGRVRIL